ncbi:MAG: leucyl aminopeptidase family protein [Planctomycetes bacterium]|nr:leucyl aminopeptidase family protein [Planctomycetota bacterium]
MAAAVQAVADGGHVVVAVPRTMAADAPQQAAAVTALAEGALLSLERTRRSGKPEPSRAKPSVSIESTLSPDVAAAAVRRGAAMAAGVLRARDLVNAPAEELGPSELAEAARAAALRCGAEVEVLHGDAVAARGFRMVAAVGRASAKPPTVTLVRRGVSPRIALIGKGVTFDSGGLDLKPADAMELMRKDMGGAAAVIGALEVMAALQLDLPFVAAIPAAENMVGPDAFRPGDVLRAYDGTTVEIGNTDAEGRLLLADALSWAREQGAERLVDYATLTGAARVALGPDLPAHFCSDETLASALEACARAGDEPVWRLPLWDGYEKSLDTPFADVSHTGSEKRAGAITAALFLRRFTGGLPWAHVDLYAWEDRGRPETPRGGNGMGVRTLAALVERLAAGG